MKISESMREKLLAKGSLKFVVLYSHVIPLKNN